MGHQPLTVPTRVRISSLTVSGTPRAAGEDPDHIQALAETADELPPITVHRPSMAVIDGIHRLRAAQRSGQDSITVRFFDGDEADAFVLAVEANTSHGLPLCLADRKTAAARILGTHPRWSDRRIATVTGLSGKTVAGLRHGADGDTTRVPDKTIGQDGRMRPTNIAERRTIASDLIEANPKLSLRQVAGIAGISPETARDVRARLRAGKDPTRPRHHARSAAHAVRSPVHEGASLPAAHGVNFLQLPPTARRLAADSTVRDSAAGRALVRMLNTHAIGEQGWRKVINDLPCHHRAQVATAARECAGAWQFMAEQLDRLGQST